MAWFLRNLEALGVAVLFVYIIAVALLIGLLRSDEDDN